METEIQTLKMRAWVVMFGPQELNVVYFTDDCDADYVRRSLVDHDGYPPGIKVFQQDRI